MANNKQLPDRKNETEFGAYLDVNGNAYVANIKNTVYLHMDTPHAYTRIYNENGGESVTPVDIQFAFSNHEPKGNAIYFDSLGTQTAFNEYFHPENISPTPDELTQMCGPDYELWEYLHNELGVIALDSQLGDIIEIVRRIEQKRKEQQ